MIKHVFGRFYTQLLFVMYNKDAREGNDMRCSADRLSDYTRDFAPVWQKFSQYDETNTLMISNYFNNIDEFTRNDLILPLYHPRLGKTDFLDDKHMVWLHSYLSFLAALED